MDKLEAIQRVLRFSDRIREWVTETYSVYFDDLDEQNVNDYDSGGYGELGDRIIQEGIKENILDKDDVDPLP